MNVFKQLKEYYWSERFLLFAAISSLVCATAISLIYPNLLRFFIDDVIGKKHFSLITLLSILVVTTVTIKAMFIFLHGLAGGRLGNRVAHNLRNALYKKLQYLSFQYYDTAKTGDLMSRLTADLEALRQFMGYGLAQIVNVIMMLLFGMIMMMFLNWKLTLITLVTMPFLAFIAFRFEAKIHPAFRSIRQAMSSLTTAVQENVTGVRTVKSFARESFEVEKFSIRSEVFKKNQIDIANLWATYFPILEFVSSCSIVILLSTGGYMVIHGSLSLGSLVAFTSLIWYIIQPMWMLGVHINNYTQSKASGERILELLNHYVHVKDSERAIALPEDKVKGHVRFDHVTFSYPEKQPAILDVTIDAPPGSVIGFLGGTGSGKSTIIQLLLHAYNVKEGKITLDGKDIADITIESLREHIAVVFQETFLFSASISSNISYGLRDISMEKIIHAAKLAKAHDFIMELPEGYETVVGERGMGLSGGQKQRIAIARALIKDPSILILDDATSAVDMETEHEIQAGFKELMNGRTTFIIAHRISSLRHADEIVVLDHGKVVQRGTHRQLLLEDGPYLETYKIQYSDQPNIAQMSQARRYAN